MGTNRSNNGNLLPPEACVIDQNSPVPGRSTVHILNFGPMRGIRSKAFRDRPGNIMCAVLSGQQRQGNPSVRSLDYSALADGYSRLKMEVQVDSGAATGLAKAVYAGRLYATRDLDLETLSAIRRAQDLLERLVPSKCQTLDFVLRATDRAGLVKAFTQTVLGVPATIRYAKANVYQDLRVPKQAAAWVQFECVDRFEMHGRISARCEDVDRLIGAVQGLRETQGFDDAAAWPSRSLANCG